MLRRMLMLAMLWPSVASAQQEQSVTEQALSTKLSAEISSVLQCTAGLITTQRQLAAAQARIKELEGKSEQAPPPTR